MKYQLVLQFEATDIADFDDLIALEEILIEHLLAGSRVDGHAFGQGEFNLFLITDEPNRTFEDVRRILGDQRLPRRLKAAYRKVASEEKYIALWPSRVTDFTVT